MIIDQVKYVYKFSFLFKFKRYVHDKPAAKTLHPLENRGLLKISGDDASVFLQGLITNDMRHFENGTKSIYAMFLNNKGRVLYDTLIHKWESETFMLECDKKLLYLMSKHLKIFKLRRKINIEDVNNEYRLWAFTSPTIQDLDENNANLNLYKDPRLSDLGYRIISSKEGSNIANVIGSDIDIQNNDNSYHYLRYKLGVSEGANDLPPAASFPLEANCDYLHGVSFHKGCYIGQEVTARVHHTGVVRKRIMPFRFLDLVDKKLEVDSIINAKDNQKSNLGKLKGVRNDYGLGLLRIKESLEAKIITINNCNAEIFRPTWWPIEAPKEIVKSNEALESKEQSNA